MFQHRFKAGTSEYKSDTLLVRQPALCILQIQRVVTGIGSLDTTSSGLLFDPCSDRDSNWISRKYKSDALLTERVSIVITL
jgi:hypothetical protein